MECRQTLAPAALFLGVAASAWGQALGRSIECTPGGLFWGGVSAAALGILAWLIGTEVKSILSGRGAAARWGCVVFVLWFGWELLQTAALAQQICWHHFSSLGVIGVLPLMLWAGWTLSPEVFRRSGRLLWWCAAAGALLCLLGARRQMAWQNLFSMMPDADAPAQQLFPEYFAAAFLCASSRPARTAWMPVGVWAILAAHGLFAALVFGGNGPLWQLELLRASELGGISRFDALLLLIWLAAMLFRLCLLTRVIRIFLKPLCSTARRNRRGVEP